MEPTYEVVWPGSPSGLQIRRIADRLGGLEGKRIGFLWDYLFRGDEIFPALAGYLEDRFESLKVVDYAEFGSTHGSEEASVLASLPERLSRHRIDAVVSGMGC